MNAENNKIGNRGVKLLIKIDLPQLDYLTLSIFIHN